MWLVFFLSVLGGVAGDSGFLVTWGVLLNFLWIVPGFEYKVFDVDEIEAEK